MILESYCSPWSDEITKFVHKYKIKRENIQTIVYDTERGYFTLFYWVEKE